MLQAGKAIGFHYGFQDFVRPRLTLLTMKALPTIATPRIQLDGQSSNPPPVGVGVESGIDVAIGNGVFEAIGIGVSVATLEYVAVGTTDSVPVTEMKRNLTRA